MNKVAKYELKFNKERDKYIDFTIVGLKNAYYRPDYRTGGLESFGGAAGLLRNEKYEGYCNLCMTYHSMNDDKVGNTNLPKPTYVVEFSPLYNEKGELILVKHDSDDVLVSIDRGGYKDYDIGEIVDANITFWKHGMFTEFNG